MTTGERPRIDGLRGTGTPSLGPIRQLTRDARERLGRLKIRCPPWGREGSTPSPGIVIRLALALVLLPLALPAATYAAAGIGQLARVDHAADGDTIDLTNGQRVRLVQIDTPEEFFRPECYGLEAAAAARHLLPPGTLVRLVPEPPADLVDRYGRLLRYVIRARDGLNVNLRLVKVGAAAPYFYNGVRGRYAARLDQLARKARAHHLGLWGRCAGTPYDPYRGVDTGPPR
jgi:endonuclease YncB( thermonuclease family)